MDTYKLAQELTADPAALGYATMTDAQAAAALNLVREGIAAYRVRRRDITGQELLLAIDVRDLTVPGSVTAAGLAAVYLESVLQQPRIEIGTDAGGDNRIKSNLDRLIGDTNGSQARLNALRFRFISRAEQIGIFETVQAAHVTEARALAQG